MYMSRQWGIYLYIILKNNTSEINTSVTRVGMIKQCLDYNYNSLCTRVNWFYFYVMQL
jgi:hypothetical protein